jgi:hypothetical protein
MSDDDLPRLLGRTFIVRKDVRAIQGADGAYRPDTLGKTPNLTYLPWSMKALRAHVAGEATYGHYVVSKEGTVKFFCFDIDLRGKALDEDGVEYNPREVWSGPDCDTKDLLRINMRMTAQGLALRTHAQLGVKTIASYSGSKGVHVYGVFNEEVTAEAAREAAAAILETDGHYARSKGKNFWLSTYESPFELEVYPKQDNVGDNGFGNLLRLPLGIHRKTNAPGFFLNLLGRGDVMESDDPITALTEGSIR